MTSSSVAFNPSVSLPISQSASQAKKIIYKVPVDSKRPFSNRIYLKVLHLTDPNSKYPFIGFLAARIYMFWNVVFVPLDMAWNTVLLPITFTCILIKYTIGLIPVGKNHSLGDALPGVKAFGIEIATIMVCTFEISTIPAGVLFARSAAILHAKMMGYRIVVKNQSSENPQEQELPHIVVTEADIRVVCRPPPLNNTPALKSWNSLAAAFTHPQAESMLQQVATKHNPIDNRQGVDPNEWEDEDSEDLVLESLAALYADPNESSQNGVRWNDPVPEPTVRPDDVLLPISERIWVIAEALLRHQNLNQAGRAPAIVARSHNAIGTSVGGNRSQVPQGQRTVVRGTGVRPRVPAATPDPKLKYVLKSRQQSLTSELSGSES